MKCKVEIAIFKGFGIAEQFLAENRRGARDERGTGEGRARDGRGSATLRLGLFAFCVLGRLEVEEVGEADGDGGEVGDAEIVALGGTVDVAQAIIIPSFEEEMAEARVGVFHAEAPGDAIVEFLLHLHGVLLVRLVGAVVEVDVVEVKIF